MKARYDPSVDILVITLSRAKIVGSKEIAPGIVADFDAKKNLVSLEILDANDRYSLKELARFSFEKAGATQPESGGAS